MKRTAWDFPRHARPPLPTAPEAKAEIYPYIHVLEHVRCLREAYAEIDRLMKASEEPGAPTK